MADNESYHKVIHGAHGERKHLVIPAVSFVDEYTKDITWHGETKWHNWRPDASEVGWPKLHHWDQRVAWFVRDRYFEFEYVLIRESFLDWHIDFWPVSREFYEWFLYEGYKATEQKVSA